MKENFIVYSECYTQKMAVVYPSGNVPLFSLHFFKKYTKKMAGVYVNELLLLIFPEDGW
jgi:hypothetical protein